MQTKKDVSSDDDDDDIFFRGNVKKHVSMYAQLESNEDQVSSDSDSDEVVLARHLSNGRTGKRRRRRGGDLNGLTSDDKRRKTSDSHQKQKEQGQGEQKRASVFDDMLSSDDDIKIVSSSMKKSSGSTSASASLSPTNTEGRRTRGRPRKPSVDVQAVDDNDDSNIVGQRLLQRIRMANALADEKRIAEEAEQAAREEIRRRQLLEEQAAREKAEEERKKQTRSGSGKELGEAIKLNVRLGNEYKKVVRIRMRANLLSIIVPFCKAFNNLDDKKVRMEIDGEIVEEGQTAEDYDLEENNVIDLVRSK